MSFKKRFAFIVGYTSNWSGRVISLGVFVLHMRCTPVLVLLCNFTIDGSCSATCLVYKSLPSACAKRDSLMEIIFCCSLKCSSNLQSTFDYLIAVLKIVCAPMHAIIKYHHVTQSIKRIIKWSSEFIDILYSGYY